MFVVFYRKIKGGEIDTLGLARFQLTAALQLRKKAMHEHHLEEIFLDGFMSRPLWFLKVRSSTLTAGLTVLPERRRKETTLVFHPDECHRGAPAPLSPQPFGVQLGRQHGLWYTNETSRRC